MGILPMSRRAILALHIFSFMGRTPMGHTGKMPVLLRAPSYSRHGSRSASDRSRLASSSPMNSFFTGS